MAVYNMTERKTCTVDAPMPADDQGRWMHPDAKEIDSDYGSAYGTYERYECPNCGLRFWVELAD